MASASIFLMLCHFLIYATTTFQLCANAQAYKNISLGSSLYANDDNLTWTSPSGDFSFGFSRLQGNEDKFILAIWFGKIPDKTIVWSANGNFPTDRESKVELTTNGQLVLTTPSRWELWKSDNNVNGTDALELEGAMLDTGNFVIASRNSGSRIWESFKNPTDTILPGQVLGVDNRLSSAILDNDYKPGKFQLRFRNGNLILVQIDVFTGNPYAAYFRELNVSQLIFNESGGHLRAKLSFDGIFTLYSHPKTSYGNESWSVLFFIPGNICLDIIDTFGSGPCGFNSICELGKHGKPICRCPPGFSPLDPNNQYNGCKQDDVSYLQQCNQEGSTLEEHRFEFVTVNGADWPLADYEQLKPSTEFECRRACLRDCNCAVAIFRDKRLVNETGTSVFFNFFSVTAIFLVVYCWFQRKLQGYFAVPTVREMELNLRSYTYKDLEEATNGFREELGRGAFGTVYKGMIAAS